VGARIRRWWWETNNWKIPAMKKRMGDQKLAGEVKEVRDVVEASRALAEHLEDYADMVKVL